ncbi:MAG: glycosyltransferase [Polaribacter sp.]
MILIDSLHINNGGGKVLLDYLVEEIESQKINVFYLFDSRCSNSYKNIPNNKKLYLKATLLNRFIFYNKKKNKFTKVLCFGNIPPPVKQNIPVFTYMHQLMFINVSKEFSTFKQLMFKLKSLILRFLKTYTNYWLVQGEIVRIGLAKRYAIDKEKINCLPFYPDADLINKNEIRDLNSFLYVSSGEPHKNHNRLIEAFCKMFDRLKTGRLILTIDKVVYPILSEQIEEKKREGYSITNLGFIDRSSLIKAYNKAEYLFFPSLEESFGLGIIEAIGCGCKVIASDLPYIKQICKPSIKFNPFIVNSIEQAFGKAILKEEEKTEVLTHNQIEKIIRLLID